jgi:hypothetical protein
MFQLITIKMSDYVKTFDIWKELQECQTKWWEHVERMEDEQIPKILSKYNIAGKRDPERPQKRWKDQFLI